MDAKTGILIAFGLAVVLPYVTVALLRGGGRIGIFVITGLFLSVIVLIVHSDLREGDRTQLEDT